MTEEKDEGGPEQEAVGDSGKCTQRFKIQVLKTLKDKIKQPPQCKSNILPQINSPVLFVGDTGSGKSTVLVNLLTRKDMMGKCFDRVFLVSPTGKTDDIQKHLKLEDEEIISDLTEAPEVIQELMDSQEQQIEKEGAHKSPFYAIVYDDVIGDRELLKHACFVKSFIACRHYNFTTFLCSQSYTAVPRKCRLQAKNIIYFKGSNSENEKICEEYAPPGYNKKAFLRLIDFATDEPYSFLHINKRVHFSERYRRNFEEIILIDMIDPEMIAGKLAKKHEQRKRKYEDDVEPEVGTDNTSSTNDVHDDAAVDNNVREEKRSRKN